MFNYISTPCSLFKDSQSSQWVNQNNIKLGKIQVQGEQIQLQFSAKQIKRHKMQTQTNVREFVNRFSFVNVTALGAAGDIHFKKDRKILTCLISN